MVRLFLFFWLLLVSARLAGQARTVGVLKNDSLSQNGYTLLAPSQATRTYLLDNCGRVVNTWTSNYRPGEAAYLLENGNLLRTARIPGNYNGGGLGGRLEMFDWSGNLVWGYNYTSSEYHAHHDVEYLPNGNILLIAWEGMSRQAAIDQGRNPALVNNAGLWLERIVELQPTGANDANIVWIWRLAHHLVQDFDPAKPNYGIVQDHPERLNLNYVNNLGPGGAQADWVHFNSIDYNPDLDQIIVNSRSTSEFYIIDHSTTIAEAATDSGGKSGRGGGFLYRWGNPRVYDRGTAADQKTWGQHDAHWIPAGYPDAGKIMLFNNGDGRPGGNYSTVDVLEPPVDANGAYTLLPGAAYGPQSVYWSYQATPPGTFFSPNISGAQRMHNGNTLICEGNSGHIFEVDPSGALHWDFVNPVSAGNPVSQGQIPVSNAVFRAYRYTPDFPGLAGKNLAPGAALELNPLPSDCEIFTTTSALNPVQVPVALRAYPNPAADLLQLDFAETGEWQVLVSDMTGRKVFASPASAPGLTIDVTRWLPGMYLIYLSDRTNNRFTTVKFSKL